FFQAEDGIRDRNVTGVQTCALPISAATRARRRSTRGVDSVARYGGEEFLVMLIEAPIATAAAVGERLRARVAAEEFGGGRVSVRSEERRVGKGGMRRVTRVAEMMWV